MIDKISDKISRTNLKGTSKEKDELLKKPFNYKLKNSRGKFDWFSKPITDALDENYRKSQRIVNEYYKQKSCSSQPLIALTFFKKCLTEPTCRNLIDYETLNAFIRDLKSLSTPYKFKKIQRFGLFDENDEELQNFIISIRRQKTDNARRVVGRYNLLTLNMTPFKGLFNKNTASKIMNNLKKGLENLGVNSTGVFQYSLTVNDNGEPVFFPHVHLVVSEYFLKENIDFDVITENNLDYYDLENTFSKRNMYKEINEIWEQSIRRATKKKNLFPLEIITDLEQEKVAKYVHRSSFKNIYFQDVEDRDALKVFRYVNDKNNILGRACQFVNESDGVIKILKRTGSSFSDKKEGIYIDCKIKDILNLYKNRNFQTPNKFHTGYHQESHPFFKIAKKRPEIIFDMLDKTYDDFIESLPKRRKGNAR